MITMDRIATLCDGNPGALSVVTQALEENIVFAASGLERLEKAGIRGSEIWILYKDICESNLFAFLYVINARSRIELSKAIFEKTHPGELYGDVAKHVFTDEFMAEEGERDV